MRLEIREVQDWEVEQERRSLIEYGLRLQGIQQPRPQVNMLNSKKMKKLQTLKGFRDFLPIKTSKKARVGVFIDEANLFYIQKELGWKIDWETFAKVLKTSFDLKILRYYLGMPASGEARTKNLKIQKILESFGYTVVTKVLKKIFIDSKKSKFKYKCNFDVEIALDITTFLPQLDLIIIVSGDSDFVATRDYVLVNKKKVLFICFEKRSAWEIRTSKHVFLENIRGLIEFKKEKTPTKSRGGVTKGSIAK